MSAVIETSPRESISQNIHAVSLPQGKEVPLPKKLKRQFYYPLVLLNALSKPTGLKARSQEATLHEDGYFPEQILHNFVNRIALLCQVEPSGDAVSSCVVLQEPHRVEYIFTSNGRSHTQLAQVAETLTAILEMVPHLDEINDKGQSETRSKMLRAVLALNRSRVKSYLNTLQEELSTCVASCQRNNSERDHKLGLVLNQIATSVTAATELANTAEYPDGDPFTRATERVIEALEALYKDSYLRSLIRRRVAGEHKLASGTYWGEMCHISDRLKAYKTAINTIFIARDNWPELFENFIVRFVPSSLRAANPLGENPQTSIQLVGRSTADPDKLPMLAMNLADLERMHSIDEIIADDWAKGLSPVVHAEVNLHSWLESSGGTRSDRFFGGYKFIGSSKPTCKLCSYYFDEHGTDVKVRPSHRNLYIQWRMPDLFDHQGPEGDNQRKILMHKIKKRVVADIERTIRDKRADYRNHDSTDQRGRDMGGSSHLSSSMADALSSRMDTLSLVGEADEVADSAVVVTFQGRRAPLTK